MLCLVAIDAGPGEIGRGTLALLKRAIVFRSVKGGLGGLDSAFGGGQTGTGLHVIEFKQQLAGRDLVALLDIDRLDGGGKRAVHLVVDDRLDEAVGADLVYEGFAADTGFTDGKAVARQVPAPRRRQ